MRTSLAKPWSGLPSATICATLRSSSFIGLSFMFCISFLFLIVVQHKAFYLSIIFFIFFFFFVMSRLIHRLTPEVVSLCHLVGFFIGFIDVSGSETIDHALTIANHELIFIRVLDNVGDVVAHCFYFLSFSLGVLLSFCLYYTTNYPVCQEFFAKFFC